MKILNTQITNHLKLEHNLSYKKGNPRPIDLDTKRIELFKILFSIKIAKRMPKIKLLINIDRQQSIKIQNKDTPG